MEGRGDSGLRNRSERGRVRGGGDSGLWNRSERGAGMEGRGGGTVASGTGVRGGGDGGEGRQLPLEQE